MLSDSRIRRDSESLLYRASQKLLKILTAHKRQKLEVAYRKALRVNDFTIISQNCMGGVLYHSLGLQFLSPTVNLCLDGEDFVKFCLNLKYYLAVDLVEVKTDVKKCPVGRLDDVEICFVHYHSFEEAKAKWDERRTRINYDKVLVLGTDRDGMLLDDNLEKFDKIPYHKLMFTAKSYPYSWIRWCKCWKRKDCVQIMTAISDLSGRRYYEKYSDIIGEINALQES